MSGAQIRANEVQKTIEPVRQPEREFLRQREQGPVQVVAPQVAYRRVQFNRDGLRPADLLALQRAVGNRGVQRMVAKANEEQQDKTTEEDSERTVQTKLTVGAPKDVYGQEADRVPGRVMTMPDTATQRPNRTGLPDGLKSGIESLSGMSMDNVNIHYNSSQPAQLNALAYTQGSDIHVAPGQEQHLPHEAWHIVQQAQGRVQPTMQMKDGAPINDDQVLEHEADVMGTKALASTAQFQDAPKDEELLQHKYDPMQCSRPAQGVLRAKKSSSTPPQSDPANVASRHVVRQAQAPVQRTVQMNNDEPLDGRKLKDSAIQSRIPIISGQSLTNPMVMKALKALDDNMDHWAKCTTKMYLAGTGNKNDDYSVHFYYNSSTKQVCTTIDYKKKFRDQREEMI